MPNEITRLLPTQRTTPTRLAKRVGFELETIYSILDEGLFCTVSYMFNGQAFQLPTGYCRIDDHLYFHGSVGSHMIRTIEKGAELCVGVTLIDGIVMAKSAFHHSVNYRSVILFGKAEQVEGEELKTEVLKQFTEHYIPGRWNELRPINASELRKTAVIGVSLSEASAKVRTGPPIDDEEDANWPCWTGVLPLRVVAGQPKAAEVLLPGVSLPEYLHDYDRNNHPSNNQ